MNTSSEDTKPKNNANSNGDDNNNDIDHKSGSMGAMHTIQGYNHQEQHDE